MSLNTERNRYVVNTSSMSSEIKVKLRKHGPTDRDRGHSIIDVFLSTNTTASNCLHRFSLKKTGNYRVRLPSLITWAARTLSTTGMSLQTPKLAISLACASTIAYLIWTIRPLHVDGICSSIYWTVRSWLWNYPVPYDFDSWFGSGKRDEFFQDRAKFIRVWHFLRPFFVSHGYDLYTFKNPEDTSEPLFPCPTTSVVAEKVLFPYARRLYDDPTQTRFDFSVSTVSR